MEELCGSTFSGQLVIKTVLAYGLVGAAQVLYKLLWGWRRSSRIRLVLEDMPATKGDGHDSPMGWIKDFAANRSRLNDWRVEVCDGQPVCKTLGFRWHPGMWGVTINEPAMVRHVLKDEFSKYGKPDTSLTPFWFYFRDFSGDGIFVLSHGSGSQDNGKAWAQMRKIAAQIFSRKNLNSQMLDVFLERAEVLRGYLQQARNKGSPVDLQSCFFKFTLDSIMQIFFAEESNTVVGVPNEYGRALNFAQHNFRVHAFDSLASFILFSTFVPWPFGGRFGGWARAIWDRFSPRYRKMKLALRVADQEAHRLVTKCRCDPNLQKRRDLVALFIQAGYDTDFVKQMMLHFVIAGHDTTACLLSWMFYELTRNQDIQSRLHDEIMEKLPPGSELNVTSLSASEMPYLNGVVYESLRLWPPVASNVRMLYEDDILPGGWKLPASVHVTYSAYSMGRDASRYLEPEAFRPERWIPFTAPAPHEFPVFNAGPRICIGMDMSILEAKTAAVELLRYCQFEMVPGQEITYGDKVTMDIKSNGKEEFMVHVRHWEAAES